MKNIVMLATVLIAGSVAVGCSATKTIANKAKAMTVSSDKAMMKLSDQPILDTVRIDVLVLEKPGFVIIHADADGKPGPVIGQSPALPIGKHANVYVRFDSSKAGAKVFPMVHTDDGNGAFEFPGPDGPMMVDGKVLVGTVNWQ